MVSAGLSDEGVKSVQHRNAPLMYEQIEQGIA